MESFLSGLFTAFKVIFLFGAAIFVHEYGHYWMARCRRLIVQAFAIGFGPKIYSWMHQGVEWSIRWIPAGGYVKLPQMITSEAIEGKTDVIVPAASPWSRILVAAAGPAMNILFALLIACVLWWVGLPVLVNPPIVGRVEPGSAEAKLGIREKDRIVAVNGAPVKSWQDINLEVVTARTNVLPVTLQRGTERFTVQMTARTSERLNLKWLDLEPLERPIVGMVEPTMPAAKIGLQPGDRFISFNGIYVLSQEHLSELINKGEGTPCELVIEREGQKMTFTVTPVYDKELKKGRIGIRFAGGHYEIQRPGPTPKEQFTEVFRQMQKAISALMYSKETGVGVKDLGGPVLILGQLAVNAKADFRLALNFMVLLNINLALINLLPLPVLDGGHILMSVYELVTRRRVSLRFQEYATTLFALLLISFMLYVTFFDLRRLPLVRDMLRQESVIETKTSAPDSVPPAGTQPSSPAQR